MPEKLALPGRYYWLPIPCNNFEAWVFQTKYYRITHTMIIAASGTSEITNRLDIVFTNAIDHSEVSILYKA